jgi:hypothetical protein
MKINGLVMHVADHCNLNCPSCSNFSNMCPPHFADFEYFEKQLARVTKIAEVKRFYLLGGEPLLHPALPDFMVVARKYLPKAQLDVVTNGILVKKWGVPLWEAMKQSNVRMMVSLYPDVKLDTVEFKRLAKEYGVVLWLRDCGKFTTLFNPEGNSDKGKAFRICFAKHCYVLNDGKLYLCPRPAFVHFYNRATGTDIKVSENDYVDIFSEDAVEKLNELDVKVTWGVTDKRLVSILSKVNDIELAHYAIKLLVNYGVMGKSPRKQPLEFCRYCVDKRVWFKWGNG